MDARRVLVLGLDPAKFADRWDPAPTLAALQRGRDRFVELGIEADYCLDDSAAVFEEALRRHSYACVVIGGGIRRDESLLGLFETVVNLVRVHAPDAAIAFNRTPDECADAALRVLG
jgi:hypothetical protein